MFEKFPLNKSKKRGFRCTTFQGTLKTRLLSHDLMHHVGRWFMLPPFECLPTSYFNISCRRCSNGEFTKNHHHIWWQCGSSVTLYRYLYIIYYIHHPLNSIIPFISRFRTEESEERNHFGGRKSQSFLICSLQGILKDVSLDQPTIGASIFCRFLLFETKSEPSKSPAEQFQASRK